MESVTTKMAHLTMAPKLGAGTGGRPVPLVTNMYQAKMMRAQPVYRYDVAMEMRFGAKSVSLVKKTIDDMVAIDHKDKCRAAFRIAVRLHDKVLGSPVGLFYDLQSTLYAIDKIKDAKENTECKEIELCIPSDMLKNNDYFKDRNPDSVTITIKRVEADYQLSLGDLSFATDASKAHLNADLVQFLEIATTQYAYLKAGDVLTYSSGLIYFSEKRRKLNGGNLLIDGVQKSIKVIEGSQKGQPQLAVVLDPKKTAFHAKDVAVSDKIYEAGFMEDDGRVHPAKLETVKNQVKNLFVEVRYGKKPTRFMINGIDKESARVKTFLSSTGETTVESYYLKQYQIELQYPLAPLLAANKKVNGERTTIYFPMELCYVCDTQRVKNTQQTSKQISDMIRSCAMLPADRVKEIKDCAKRLQLNGDAVSGSLRSAGLSVATQLTSVQGRALPPPEIVYKDNKKFSVDPNSGKWKATGAQKPKFLLGASINRWAMMCVADRPQPRDDALMKNFAEKMVRECQGRGMRVNNPVFYQAVQGRPDSLESMFRRAKQDNMEFLFFVQDGRLQAHKDIKFFERKYEIITQDLNQQTCRSVVEQNKFLSLENIVNKTNVKLGGLNYSLIVNAPNTQHLFAKGRLYLGFQVSHPAPLSDDQKAKGMKPKQPTVVGVAGNITNQPAAFVGDVFFQEPRDDRMADAMETLVRDFALRYKDAVGVAPAEVIIYRNGASDGQYQTILDVEVQEVIRAALTAAGAGSAKLTYMVVSKLHNVRLMPAQITGIKAPEQNVKPGTVVDTNIVDPVFAEFYLNSHQTLQGSAKTPKYTVLYDQNNFPMSYLELMTYVLSYGHQIVGLPTSLPTPVYVAGRYAERGATLLSASRHDSDMCKFSELTEALGYGSTKIGKNRLNA
ncbi:hypothetical protein L596_028677 [Steinernema carpocapsae]|uniref:Piwi domain-containing protein n=1 Tax=Steinernema carpocapsae TaxID=34508 RepID=A0A4U5LZ30_STECR|nr:hypothetical protein L596_028677 [Steinernema carpocapsae]